MEVIEMNDAYDDFLVHHGVKGQKWGDRNGPPYPLSPETKRLVKTAKEFATNRKNMCYNLQKWGKNPDNNVLYVMGTSADDCATMASKFYGQHRQSELIGLDLLYDSPHTGRGLQRSALRYIEKNVPDYKKIEDNFDHYKKERFSNSEDAAFYWKTMNDVCNKIPDYGKEQFDKGKRVIVSGTQLMSKNTVTNRDSLIKGRPTVLMETRIKDAEVMYQKQKGNYKKAMELKNMNISLRQMRNEFAKELDAMQAAEYYAFGNSPMITVIDSGTDYQILWM